VNTEPGPIGIAGAGRMAQALGRLLRERGEPVVAVASRNLEHARAAAAFIGVAEAVDYASLTRRANRVLIAVADDAVPLVAAALAEAGMKEGAALHTCGARGPEALAGLEANGVSCATLHPLQTSPLRNREWRLCPAARSASPVRARPRPGRKVSPLCWAGAALRIAADRRPLYHAAAVMASNYVVALIDAAAMLMGAAGIGENEPWRPWRHW